MSLQRLFPPFIVTISDNRLDALNKRSQHSLSFIDLTCESRVGDSRQELEITS